MTDPKIDPAPKGDGAETPVTPPGDRSEPVRPAPRISDPPLHAPASASLPPVDRIIVKRVGGGMATFGALIALTAAGVSIAGPSLRPYLAEQLTARLGEHELIGILTGTAAPKPKDAVQLDLAAFDRRVAALGQALGGPPGGPAVDSATLAALTKALGQPLPVQGPSPEALKLAELETRLAALVGRLDTRLDALDQRITQTATTAAATATAQSASVAAVQSAAGELATRLSAAEQATEQAAATQAKRADALEQMLAAVQAKSADDLAGFAERLTAVDRQLADVEERGARLAATSGNASVLALVTRIRFSLEMSEPFAEEVGALSKLIGDDPDARAALESLNAVAAQGVPNLPRLQRRLAPLLANIAESEKAAASSWYTRATALLFWSPTPPSRANSIGERVDGIARDLRGGQLASALWKLRALDIPLDEAVQAWIVEANKRLAADQAVRTLTGLAFRRAEG